MKTDRYPLPERFPAELSDKAFAWLRALNETWHLGNNYLLVVLLEHLEEIADSDALDLAFRQFITDAGVQH